MYKYNDSVFKGIFETALDAIITIDEKGTIQAFNPAAINLFGYSAEEVEGSNVTILMPEHYAKNHDEYLRAYSSTGIKHIIGIGRNVEGKHKNGTVFPLHLSVSEAVINGNKLYVGFARDIREFKDIQTKLSISENKAQAILDTAIDGIATINVDGTLLSVNQALTSLFDYNPEELIGKPVEILMPEPYAKEHSSYLKHYLETNERHVIGIGRTVKAKRKNGEVFPIHLSVSEFRIDDEIFFAGIIRDMTEQVNNENFLTSQRNKLKSLNTELESFSYSVSHDLSSPLRHIIGYIELLNKEIANYKDKSVIKYIKVITDEARRMDELIKSLLSFSRLGRESLRKKDVDFNDLIHQVIDLYTPETDGRNISWEISSFPVIYCDEKMLRLALENLISNALKFTKNIKKVVISIDYTELASEYQFSIKDNGIGFDPKDTDKLFKVFQRLHQNKDFKGTGIGLVNIKKIIEKHGGKVWIEGEINKGVTVFFTIPFKNESTIDND